uniref:Dipeptidyl peptidase like 10 n=1 Tax=Oryzias latipes TaxID=8090 RepID=A0A3B3HRV8_ORYLA
VSPPQRNWKGIAISLLVIVVVCSLISLSVVILTPTDLPDTSRSRLTVADLYQPEFSVHDPEATWVSESEVVYRNRDGHVVKFNFKLNETELILSNKTFVSAPISLLSSVSLPQMVLLELSLQVYRHSYTASYSVYNIYTREVWELNPPEVKNAMLQHASWGKQGHQLIYIFENNIYYQSDVRSNSLRITSSGMEEVIFNGLADWLYEEEILNSHLAHWWSPDSERLAFLTINDSLVPKMGIPQFTGSTYPRGLQYPYPMAGQTNPAVKLSVVNLFGATHTLELQPPDHLRHRDFYITMVKWISDTHLAVRWLNRAQNSSLLTVCDTTVGACLQRHEESSETWLSRQTQEPLFSTDRSRFFLALPVRQGGQGDFHHITMFTKQFNSKQDEVRHLTSGHWEVTRILAYDENNNVVYFLSTENATQQRHLYRVSTFGLFQRQCLTCHLQEECAFLDADVSPDAWHAILRCQGVGTKRKKLRCFPVIGVKRSNLSKRSKTYFILENNSPLRAALQSRRLTSTEIQKITIENYGINDPHSADGAPGQQAVTDQFHLGWDSVLSGSEHVIVARLDGRGTGFGGQRLLHQVYHRLGTVDTEDQLAALEKPYVCLSNGYGGFLTLMMLKSTDQLIKCAAVQAPIIDWSLYGEFQAVLAFDFAPFYVQASKVLPNQRGLPGGTLFLAHGTADANVHFQHSAELIKHFIKIGANYTMQIFPDEGHFLSTRSRIQLTHSLIGYFRGCLLDTPPPLDQRDDD